MDLIPSADVAASMTFTFTCNGIVTPFSYNPEPVSGYLGLQNSNLKIQVSQSVDVERLVTVAD